MLTLGVVVVAVACVSRMSYLAHAFDGDGAMFAYMGKLVTEGGRFGEDLIDNKFPTVGLITSVFWRTFGASWVGYVVTQWILTMIAATLLMRQATRSFGTYAAAPTFLVAGCLMNLNSAVMAGFQLETLQAFFAAVAAACGLAALTTLDGRNAFACGLACGCAVLVKPTGAAVGGAFALAALLAMFFRSDGSARQWFGLLIWSAIGFLIPAVGALLFLHVSDQIRIIPTLATQISEYAKNSSFAADDLFRPFSILVLFLAALLIRGWVYRRRTVAVTAPNQLAVWSFAILWLTIEFTGVLMQRRMYGYHFLPLAAPAALVFAAVPRRNTFGQLAGVLALPLVFSIWGARDVLAAAQRDTAPAVATWLEAHTTPGERVWRDITPQILIRSDLRTASQMQLTFLFMNSDTAPAQFTSMLLNDLRARRASYIVLPTDIEHHVHYQSSRVRELSRLPSRQREFAAAWQAIDRFARDHYQPVHTIGNETIWMRNAEVTR